MNVSAANVLVGIIGVLQGYFFLSAMHFGILLFRACVGKQKSVESSLLNLLCITLGTSFGTAVVLLVPAVLVTEVLRIKSYTPNVWLISVFVGVVLLRLHIEVKARRRHVKS